MIVKNLRSSRALETGIVLVTILSLHHFMYVCHILWSALQGTDDFYMQVALIVKLVSIVLFIALAAAIAISDMYCAAVGIVRDVRNNIRGSHERRK